MTITPPKPLPPPTAQRQPPAKAALPQTPSREFAVSSGRVTGPQRVVIYGSGGIGKSSLAALAPNPVFIDIESGTRELDVRRFDGIETFEDLRALLHSDKLDGFQTIVLDSATKAEELAIAFTLATIPHEKGHYIQRLEGYGFSKGLGHVYDTYMLLLQDLDRQIRKERNVVLIAHDCINDVPNPVGEDFIRYEPHLQSPKSGKSSIRNRVVQWADHVLFIGYDVVAKDGKGHGGGTRTIWTTERPDHVAKSRSVAEPVLFNLGDDTIWTMLLGGVK